MTARDPQDVRAERLLRLGLSVSTLLRTDGPRRAKLALTGLDAGQLLDLAVLLAACVDHERTTTELLAWWFCPPTEADLEERA